MQTIIAAIVFGLILITAIIMIVIYLSYKGVRKIKQEAQECLFQETTGQATLPNISGKGTPGTAKRRHCPQ